MYTQGIVCTPEDLYGGTTKVVGEAETVISNNKTATQMYLVTHVFNMEGDIALDHKIFEEFGDASDYYHNNGGKFCEASTIIDENKSILINKLVPHGGGAPLFSKYTHTAYAVIPNKSMKDTY